MKLAELRKMDSSQLEEKLSTTLQESFNLRMARMESKDNDTSKIRKVRREAAQIKTILREKEIVKNAEEKN